MTLALLTYTPPALDPRTVFLTRQGVSQDMATLSLGRMHYTLQNHHGRHCWCVDICDTVFGTGHTVMLYHERYYATRDMAEAMDALSAMIRRPVYPKLVQYMDYDAAALKAWPYLAGDLAAPLLEMLP